MISIAFFIKKIRHPHPVKILKQASLIALLMANLTTAYSTSLDTLDIHDAKDYPAYPAITSTDPNQTKLLKRGEYLVRLGDCISCHTETTKKPVGAAFAGNLPLKTPFGTFYSPNITPDQETGIGKWTFEDFKRAMHQGKTPDGSNLFPVFPYPYYSKVSDDDLRAMWAYLQAIPAVKNTPRKNTLPFPFNWRLVQYGWKILFFYPYNDPFKYDSTRSGLWNRGAYIVEGLGHCAMCHSPLNPLGAPKRKYHLSGGFIDGYWAPNITKYGLYSVSVDDIVKIFQNSKLPHEAGRLMGPMTEVAHNSLEKLTEKDQRAIAIYLKTVVSDDPLNLVGSDQRPTLARGKKVYNKACSNCHSKGQGGAPIIGDAPNWNKRALQGKDVLYRHVIDGFNLMPIKGGCVSCSDQDLEASVDYLINASLTTAQLLEYQNPKLLEKKPEVDGHEIYEKYCSVCHEKGSFGAPITGDKEVWAPILKKNLDVLLTNTITDRKHVAYKGGCRYCSTSEIKAAVKYMVEKSKTKGDYSLW